MPATSMIEIGGLIDPRMLVEVEAIACKPGIGAAGRAQDAPTDRGGRGAL